MLRPTYDAKQKAEPTDWSNQLIFAMQNVLNDLNFSQFQIEIKTVAFNDIALGNIHVELW